MSAPTVVFLLSPANCGGVRARVLLQSRTSPLADRLGGDGAPLGEVFTFMSSLYFRGKLAYANRFGTPPSGWAGALVMAPGKGLVPADTQIRVADLRAMADVPVDPEESRYREPLIRDARSLERALGPDGRAVLLGSVATDKYVGPLTEVLGDRLLFPPSFVGRGDLSRGGLLLRCAQAGTSLEYTPVLGAVRNGSRPPRLERLKRRKGPSRV
jgi:hypothetical protein